MARRLAGFVIDCQDSKLAMARKFWSGALGLPVVGDAGADWSSLLRGASTTQQARPAPERLGLSFLKRRCRQFSQCRGKLFLGNASGHLAQHLVAQMQANGLHMP